MPSAPFGFRVTLPMILTERSTLLMNNNYLHDNINASRTFKDFGQVSGEKNVSGLAAAVGLQRRPSSARLKIIPVERIISMNFGGDGNDAAWRRTLQFVQQQVGQVEVT